MSKGFDWGGFLSTTPGDADPSLVPSVFGRQLLAVDDATGALSLIGAEPAAGNPPVDGYVWSSTAAGVRSWIAPAAGGGGAWGSITGTLASQTDLQTALDAKQASDADLTAIAALTTTSFGRGFLPLANEAAARSYIGAGTSNFSGAYGDLTGLPDLTAYQTKTGTLALGGFSSITGQIGNSNLPSSLSIASGKTLTVSNTLTLLGTDGASLAVGGGGTLGSAAYTSSSAYIPSSWVDTDGTLAANSDSKVATQKAVKTYVDANAGGGGTIPVGNTVFIDVINGVDATGIRGRQDKPFLTFAAAKAAASTGDKFVVAPGTYNVGVDWLKSGSTYELNGVTINGTDTSNSATITDDTGPLTAKIHGGFSLTNNEFDYSGILLIDPDSNVEVDAEDLTASGIVQANVQAGKLILRAKRLSSDTDDYTIAWWNGEMHVTAESITGIADTSPIWTNVNSTPTGDLFVTANDIVAEDNQAVTSQGSDTAAASWIEAKTIRTNSYYAIYNFANRLYVRSLKVFGGLFFNGAGLSYVTTDKITATQNTFAGTEALFLKQTTGTSWIEVKHLDDAGKTGLAILVTGGSVTVTGAQWTGSAVTDGIKVTGGALRLVNCRIDTSANSSTSPITKTGGTLILENCTLIAHASADSIDAPDAQDVKVYGTSVANKAKNSNVTIQVGTLTVDTDVQ